jgi:hypothetical protein
MKSYRSLRSVPALLALILLVACEGVTVPNPEQGMFAGRWDGGIWIGDASALLATGTPGGGNVLYVFGSRPRGGSAYGADESLSARVAFAGPGLYALGPNDVYFLELTGGDVVSAQYNGLGPRAGLLRITRFDGPGGVVEGELSFRAATTSRYASYGPTARLDDGKFRAIVQVSTVLSRSP